MASEPQQSGSNDQGGADDQNNNRPTRPPFTQKKTDEEVQQDIDTFNRDVDKATKDKANGAGQSSKQANGGGSKDQPKRDQNDGQGA